MSVFVTPGGQAYRGILALREGPLRTTELAEVMGIPPRRVQSCMLWARVAGAVRISIQGKQGSGHQSTWEIGDTPTVLRGESGPPAPTRWPPRAPVASVFEWRP